jgi:hypothetical protein
MSFLADGAGSGLPPALQEEQTFYFLSKAVERSKCNAAYFRFAQGEEVIFIPDKREIHFRRGKDERFTELSIDTLMKEFPEFWKVGELWGPF